MTREENLSLNESHCSWLPLNFGNGTFGGGAVEVVVVEFCGVTGGPPVGSGRSVERR